MAGRCPIRWGGATGFEGVGALGLARLSLPCKLAATTRANDHGAASIMTRKRHAFAVLAGVLALSGCGRGRTPSASSVDSHAPGTTTASAAGSCNSYVAGTPGVVRTFCDGPAVVKVSVDGKDHALTGGTCQTQAGMFVLNLGVVANGALGGPKPDYVGMTVPVTSGHFDKAVAISVTVDGKNYVLTTSSGDVGPNGGAFEGMTLGGGKVVGSFTC